MKNESFKNNTRHARTYIVIVLYTVRVLLSRYVIALKPRQAAAVSRDFTQALIIQGAVIVIVVVVVVVAVVGCFRCCLVNADGNISMALKHCVTAVVHAT